MAQETTDRIIRASEVGRYVFCARAWWLGSIEGIHCPLAGDGGG